MDIAPAIMITAEVAPTRLKAIVSCVFISTISTVDA